MPQDGMDGHHMTEGESVTESVRTAMNFPADLKSEIQQIAGTRGMTEWVLNACREKLGRPVVDKDEQKSEEQKVELAQRSKDLTEAQETAQRLADAFVMLTGDIRPDPFDTLQELTLPQWLDRTGWPAHYQYGLGRPDPEVEAELEQIIEEEQIPVGSNEPTSIDARFSTRSEYLAKVLEKAETLGLQRASDLTPSPKEQTDLTEIEKGWVEDESVPEPDEEAEKDWIGDEAKLEKFESLNPEHTVGPPVCEKCGSELVSGECWECF